MTSPPNTTGWNSAISGKFNNFAQVNTSTTTTFATASNEETSTTTNSTTSEEMQVFLVRSPRDEYYSTHYSPQTGLRIALTLGSFFLFVLLTLLYKSKCKKHSSRCPSPLLPGPLLGGSSQQPSPHNLPPLLCPGGVPSQTSSSGPTDFLHHQVHPYHANNHNLNMNPYNHHNNSYDLYPNYNESSSGGGGFLPPLPHPALLLTSANSDSSDEDLSSTCKPISQSAAITRYLQSGSGIGSGSGGARQSIDIHVILPTPTISPSSSEHFRAPESGPSNAQPNNKLPPSIPPLLLHHHPQLHNYYLNDRRRSSASSSNTTSWPGGGSPLPYPFTTGSPFTFPDIHNLKYVDDTSSENIPGGLRGDQDEDEDQDEGSVGSDSVFACCEPPPPPLPPRNFNSAAGSRRPSTSPSYYSGLGLGAEDSEWRVTLSQARAQVHHRDSFASDLESVNDYLEGISGGGGGGGSGSGTNSRRRSSSTQTTLSDLQHCLGIANAAIGVRSPCPSSSPRLSPNPFPHHFMSLRQSPVQFLAAPPAPGQGFGLGGGSISPRIKGGRKRSVDALLLGVARREQQHQHIPLQQLQMQRLSGPTTPLLDARRLHNNQQQQNQNNEDQFVESDK